ncbi:ribonuclease III [Pseudoxanthobacter sp.]|uniref:ribonuclease III n=1 Tax=Pseudoxanthobacter sp. TaxID=1925742 RepID=UPI002FE0CF7F
MIQLQERRLAALEKALGHHFSDRRLITRALTHPSAVAGHNAVAESYQRLEFLGDRVLGLAVAEMLHATYTTADEGDLARRLNQLVRRETCAEVAIELGLDQAMLVGTGEAQGGGRRKVAILGDVCEAVLAALYLDAGFEAARAAVQRLWGARMREAVKAPRDAKTTLQEWAQGRGLPTPVYQAVGRSGPDHAPVFTILVSLEGLAPAEGRGKSKREAEQVAATALLVREGIWSEDNHGG